MRSQALRTTARLCSARHRVSLTCARAFALSVADASLSGIFHARVWLLAALHTPAHSEARAATMSSRAGKRGKGAKGGKGKGKRGAAARSGAAAGAAATLGELAAAAGPNPLHEHDRAALVDDIQTLVENEKQVLRAQLQARNQELEALKERCVLALCAPRVCVAERTHRRLQPRSTRRCPRACRCAASRMLTWLCLA